MRQSSVSGFVGNRSRTRLFLGFGTSLFAQVFAFCLVLAFSFTRMFQLQLQLFDALLFLGFLR